MLEGIGRTPHSRCGFEIVVLCQGRLSGKNFYAFVAVDPEIYSAVRAAYEPFRLSGFDHFGRELRRGWGEYPPPDVIAECAHQHDVIFDPAPNLIDRLVKLGQGFSYAGHKSPTKPLALSA